MILVEGPPRCGKSVFSGQLKRAAGGALLLDAAAPEARNLIREPGLALEGLGREHGLGGRILAIDRADLEPGLLSSLAGFVRSGGLRGSRLVLFGRVFPESRDLPRLSLGPLELSEVGQEARARHWFRGGYPEAFSAEGDEAAMTWLRAHIEAIAEARFAGAGLPWAPSRTRNLLSMLAEAHGSSLNESAVAASLGVSRPTIVRSTSALERLGILRSLPSFRPDSGARATRSPALFIRDTGILHALLGFSSVQGLMGSSRLAGSWQGYVIEAAIRRLPEGMEASRYLSKDGSGFELLLSREGRIVLSAAIRWARTGSSVPRGALAAAAILGSSSNWLVLPEAEEGPAGEGFRVIGLRHFLDLVGGL
jgi:uncharacterized protein